MSKQELSAKFAKVKSLPQGVRNLLEKIEEKFPTMYGSLADGAYMDGLFIASETEDRIKLIAYRMLENNEPFASLKLPEDITIQWLEQNDYAYVFDTNKVAFTDKMFTKLEDWAKLEDVPSLELEVTDKPSFEALIR